MAKAVVTCFRLEAQEIWRAFSRAWAKTGKRMAARIAMMAMTTSSSMSVKPERGRRDAGQFNVGQSFLRVDETDLPERMVCENRRGAAPRLCRLYYTSRGP